MTNDANRDPLTGAPGAHPVGTGVGAAAGGATGAAIGSVVGPLGTALGAVIGAVAGGLAGKATAEAIDPTVEDAYWRDRYVSEPYYRDGYTYDDYAPAYGVGMGSTLAEKYRGRPFDEYEADLARDWDIYRGESRLTWPEASPPPAPRGTAPSAIAARSEGGPFAGHGAACAMSLIVGVYVSGA